MNIYLSTPTPDFAKEIADIVSVFFGEAALLPGPPQPEGLHILHTESVQGTQRHCAVQLHGAIEGQWQNVETILPEALAEKRLHKRQVKLAVYYALKQATGRQAPWGALTGIRPTRLLYAAMAEGVSPEEAGLLMQQTFDVTAPKAQLLVQVARLQQALPQAQAQQVDVYIGIPFCATRCRYCSFISAQVGDGRLLQPYVKALITEIEALQRLIAALGFAVRAFYMGGGTPTALPAPLLQQVLQACAPLVAAAGEATVEAGRPDTIDADKLRIIHASGARRISINPQTIHETTLRLIGRRHTQADTQRAYALARQAGFDHINMDLIAGLPGENERMFADTLAWAQNIAPQSLTVHTLCIKRSSDMYRWQDLLPPGSMAAQMTDMGAQAAQQMGMRPYYLYRQKHMAGNLENVGYALPGYECLYNIDAMEDSLSILAAGAGAISKRVWPGRSRIVRAPNVKEIDDYIARVDEMIARKTALWDV